MIETTLASLLALLVALATFPGLVLFVGWSALVFFVGWRWAMHKATSAPEWFARRNAQAQKLEASARDAWARILAELQKAKG